MAQVQSIKQVIETPARKSLVKKNSKQEVRLITSVDSEKILLQRVGEHDSEAFFQLWLLHQEHLYRCCLRWMGSQMDAEDALSEIMLRARQKLPRYAHSILNLEAWLTKLGRHLCFNLHKKSKTYNKFVQNKQEIEKIAYDASLLDGIFSGELYHFLSQAISNLPPRLSEPARRCFLLQQAPQEVAGVLNLSAALLRKRLQEARIWLKPLLEGYLLRSNGDGESNDEPKIKAQLSVIYWPVHACLPNRVKTFYLPLPDKPARVEQKLKKIQKYLKAHPNGWKKRLQLANLLYSIGHWEDALDCYRQVQTQQPDLLEVALQQGQILELMGRADEAVTIYQNTLFRVSSEPTQHHLRGLIAKSRHDWRKAQKEFDAATIKEPKNAAHWHELGRVCLSRQAYAAACKAFDAALALDANDLVALSESYEALVALDRFDEARQRVIKTYELVPHDFLALQRLISEYLQQGFVWDKKGEQTKKLIRMARGATTPAAEVLLANYHFLRNKPKQGIKVLKKCANRHPLNATAWYYYALYLLRTETDLQEAAYAIQNAHALDQNDQEIYQIMGEILPAAGIT